MTVTFNGEEMRRRRQAEGIRPERVAIAVDRCTATIRFYEQGRAVPTLEMAGRIADLLGCRLADLLSDDG
jgi:predicted transcriptional regulator